MKQQSLYNNQHVLKKMITVTAVTVFSFCLINCTSKSSIDKPKPLPKLDFDYTLHNLKTIADAKCETGFIEGKISGLSFWEEQLLNRYVGAVTSDDLEAQSFSWHSSVMRGFTKVENNESKLLQQILDDLVTVLDQEGIKHPEFKIFLVRPKSNQKIINAWVTGSYIYFSEDIMAFLEHDPNQICAVLGHEISHVLHNHLAYSSQRKDLAIKKLGKKWGKRFIDLYERIIASPAGQSLELEADLTALLLMNLTKKYDPFAAVKPLEKFSELQPKNIPALAKLLATHPVSAVRVNCVSGALARAKLRAENKHLSLKK